MDGDSGACGVAMRGGVEGQWLLCTRQVCCFGGGFHHGAMVVSLAGVLVWSTESVLSYHQRIHVAHTHDSFRPGLLHLKTV
jgi:hypothetical protein